MFRQLRDRFDDLRSSLWFIPALVVIACVALAAGMIELEDGRHALADGWPRLFGAGAEGSRALLSTIAGSMITVAGVSFSITVVALTLASSQYTSRVLGNFMRDRPNQWVLGVFVGVFGYCLVVLRSIRSGDEGSFVPALAVFVGLALAFVAIGFLIFFIHHIADSIQAASIIAATARDTITVIDQSFTARCGDDDHRAQPAALDPITWHAVSAAENGYVQRIDVGALVELAARHGRVIRMLRGVGEFATRGEPLAELGPVAPDDALRDGVRDAYAIAKRRSISQDPGFGIRQLVDVALKALSPGVNDTTTAVSCVDFLGAILAHAIDRRIAEPPRWHGGELRLLPRGPSFELWVAEAFDQVRQSAGGNVAVLRRQLEVLTLLLGRTRDTTRRDALALQVHRVAECSARTVPAAHDRERLDAARDVALRAASG